MPVTAGHVPGLTSGLRRVPTDPGRFHSGRWFVLAEGALVSAFGIAGLISALLTPHAGPTGAPVLGLATTPAHSAILLAFGAAAVAAATNRRAAVIVTALSAVAYTMLLFIGSVATARNMPTPLGFHAADILLHGVLAVVNLALLMWLIPDELGDEAWVPRRRRGRGGRQRSAPDAGGEAPSALPDPAAARTDEAGAHPSPPEPAEARERPRPPESTAPPAGPGAAHRALLEQPAQEAHAPSTHGAGNSTRVKHFAARATDAVLSRGPVVPVGLVLLAAVVGVVIWIRRR